MNVIVYAIPVFILLMLAEFAFGLSRGRNVYRLNDAVGSLSAGILSQVSGVFLLALSLGVYALVQRHLALFALPAGDWRVWVAALIAYDFCYYWNHRIDHEVGLFWAAHVVHHQSDNFNLSTALRQTSTGSFLGWIFYLPMAVAGVPPAVFVGVGLIDLLYQFWIHTELVGKLGWFDFVFASPSNHRVHHGINDRYLDKNYGGILILWDRLFGTFEEERERPVYGVRGGLGAFDPLSANVAYYRTMARLSWAADDWRDRLRVWFAPPGWVPANLRIAGPQPGFDLTAVETYDPPAAPLVSVVAFAALIGLVGATALFLSEAPGWSWMTGLVVFLAIAASLWAVGALLDGRLSIFEALFVLCAGLTCAAYATGGSVLEGVAKPLTLMLLIAAFARRDGSSKVKRLVLAGLVASLAGDVLLLSPTLFLPGLAAFLLTHLFYIAAFSTGVGFLPSRIVALFVAALAAAMLAYLWPGVGGGLRLPVAAYVAVIACDAAQACGRATILRNGAAIAVAAGALLFMASDLTLALYRFRNPGWPVDLWTLPTYYAAQGLIAFFILPRTAAEVRL